MIIRPATAADLPTLGQLGAELIRVHHGFDAQRFFVPEGDAAAGYAWFLGDQLANPDAVVLVAEHESHVVGYVYAGVEPFSWKELREACGFVHDLIVAPDARRLGAGEQLLDAATEWLRAKGMPRVILWTAHPNAVAQRLFARAGFRPTMIEMTREL